MYSNRALFLFLVIRLLFFLFEMCVCTAAADEQMEWAHNLPRRFTLLPAGPSHVAAPGPAQSRRSLGQRTPVAPPPPQAAA